LPSATLSAMDALCEAASISRHVTLFAAYRCTPVYSTEVKRVIKV